MLTPADIERLYGDAERLLKADRPEQALRALRTILQHCDPIARTETEREILEPYQAMPAQFSPRPADPSGKPVRLVMDYFTAALYLSAYALTELGDFEAARDHLEEVAGLWPLNTAVRLELAFVLCRLDQLDSALATLQEAAEQSPDDARVQRELAWVHNHRGHHVEAAEAAERAVSLDPAFRPAYEELLFACERLERADRAAEVRRELERLSS